LNLETSLSATIIATFYLPKDNDENMSDNDTNNAPTKAMMQMLAPDGYYTYLNIPKVRANNGSSGKETSEDPLLQIDLDLVKKNYRKLSIRVRAYTNDDSTLSLIFFASRLYWSSLSALVVYCIFCFVLLRPCSPQYYCSSYFFPQSIIQINVVAMSRLFER